MRCCIIATANQPLEELVAQGTFREDLFETLRKARVSLPAIRERDKDVVHIARHFLDETIREQGFLPMTLSEGAMEALLEHHWPGNARELRAVIRAAADRCVGHEITVEHLRVSRRHTGRIEEAAPKSGDGPRTPWFLG